MNDRQKRAAAARNSRRSERRHRARRDRRFVRAIGPRLRLCRCASFRQCHPQEFLFAGPKSSDDTQIAQRIGQISEATDIPLIVDGGSICVDPVAFTRAVKLYERAGAAAIRFEDAPSQ